MSGINPSRYLAYKNQEIPFDEYVRQEVEDLIRQKIAEIRGSPLKNSPGLVESLNHLIKTYLLLSGKPTTRQETIQRTDTSITVFVEQLRKELGEAALYDLDVKALEMHDDEPEQSE